MKPLLWIGPAAALLLAACGAPKGSSDEGAPQALAAGGGSPVVVVGTTLEAASRTPLAGVRVEGPGGVVAESDADGRFVLRGLSPGAQGDLLATADGLAGSLRLRPLRRGRLEVVVFLRPKTP